MAQLNQAHNTNMEMAEKKNHYVEALVDFIAGVLGDILLSSSTVFSVLVFLVYFPQVIDGIFKLLYQYGKIL